MTADEVKKLLGLVPHPCEGGSYVRMYEAEEFIPAETLGRYHSPRRTGTAIYYLLEPGTFSEMHRLASDEIFHFYAGDPVEQLQLAPDGTGLVVLLGNDLTTEARPQVVVARGVWQGAGLAPGGSWALLGCTVSPGFEYEDYAAGKCAELAERWPEWAQRIAQLTRS